VDFEEPTVDTVQVGVHIVQLGNRIGVQNASSFQTVNNKSGNRIVVEHGNLQKVTRLNQCSLIDAQKEADWFDEGGDDQEEGEDVLPEVRPLPVLTRRSLRSQSTTQMVLLSDSNRTVDSSSAELQQDASSCSSNSGRQNSSQTCSSNTVSSSTPNASNDVLVPVFIDAVDGKHNELLQKVNDLIAKLASLKDLLRLRESKDDVIYLHLLEEEIVVAREAELNYLRTSSSYHHLFLQRVADKVALPPIFPSRIKHVRDADTGKWPSDPITDGWIEQALGPDLHKYPDNINDLIDKNVDGQHQCTLREFHQKLNDWAALNNVTTKGRDDIVSMLVNTTNLDLGVRFHPSTNNIIHTSHEYLQHDPRDWLVDCCINQCVLYVGEFASHINCPECGTPRFSKCNYGGNCQYGIECSPYVNLTHKYRASNQILIYRYA
jgi:hypothetical protein